MHESLATPRSPTAHAAILLVAVALVYGFTISFEFVWDDKVFLLPNDVYRSFDLRGMLLAAANRVEYLPVRDLSYAVDFALWGANPLGFHLTNVVLYFGNVLFVYLTTRRLAPHLFGVGRGFTRRAPELALVTSLLFAVHPLHSEVVSFVSCRNVLLSGLFFFASCHLFLRSLDPDPARPHLAYVASLACCALAILSKATSMVLPGCLLLMVAVLDRPIGRRLIALVPFFLLAGTATLLFGEVALRAGLVDPERASEFGAASLGSRLSVAVQIPFFYLQKLLLPVGLTVEYATRFAGHPGSTRVLLAASTLVIASLLATAGRSRWPFLFFGLGWYLVALVPLLNWFATHPVVADRYAYLPSYGFLIAVVGVLDAARRRLPASVPRAAVLAAMLALALLAARRNLAWRSDETLWQEAIRVTPDHSAAYLNLGAYYFGQGEPGRAFEMLETHAKLVQDDGDLRFYRGLDAVARGDYSGAIGILRGGAPESTASIRSLCLLGKAHAKAGHVSDAIRAYLDALHRGGPDPWGVLERAAADLETLRRRIAPELEGLRRGVADRPEDLNARARLAVRLDEVGLYEEAMSHYLGLVERGGENWRLYHNMGNAARKLGQPRRAARYYEKSVAMNPSNLEGLNNLGLVLETLGEYPRAIQAFETAIEADPSFEKAPYNLALLYFRIGDAGKARRHFAGVAGSFPQLRGRARWHLERIE